jgi:peptidoglycan/LPS O-acetylase OafA/YrhL
MIIMGTLIGAITFYFQDSSFFPAIHTVPFWKFILIMLIGFTLLPVPLSLDIRGWTEMHPLDGPAWSLLYEYIGNLLYALFIRRLPNTILTALVIVAGAAVVHLAVWGPTGDMIGGWSLEALQIRIGFTRLLFPFLAGLLLSRVVKPGQISNAFGLCSLLLIAALAFPRIGGHNDLWKNGIYDAAIIILLFPLIVFIGASGQTGTGVAAKASRFLGDISYPIYITHYPLIYLFMAWVAKHKQFIKSGTTDAVMTTVLAGIVTLTASILLAWTCLKFYDLPVRKWLSKKWLASNN